MVIVSLLFSPLLLPELSASDDSSLSDGLILEEGEWRVWGLGQDGAGFAEFPSEDSQRTRRFRVLAKGLSEL